MLETRWQILVGLQRNAISPKMKTVLILFVIRLLQLKGKRYRWRPAVSEHTLDVGEGQVLSLHAIRFGTPDSDELVSYLSVVRQFWLRKEPLHYRNIAAILINVSLILGDAEMEKRIRTIGRAFKDKFSGCTYSFTRGVEKVTFSIEELVDFWLNTYYFHTDVKRLPAARIILGDDFMRDFSRQHFEGYLDGFLAYSRQLGVEALGILWKGILPEGTLHYLLNQHAYEEILPLVGG